jgi:hypothetical protein
MGTALKIPFISRHTTQKLVYALAPKNRWGDKVVALYWFLRCHNRLPTNKPLINDVLYKLKTTDGILDPTRVFVSDKENVKLFVKAVLGEDRCAPTFAVLTTPEEIDAYDFPATCCIKPTQTSGPFILRKNGEDIDREEMKTWLSLNFYTDSREANYRLLKPKIIVEELLFDNKNIVDYKFFCFGGEPKAIQVDKGRDPNRQAARFDTQWTFQEGFIDYNPLEGVPKKPENLNQMLSAAAKLAPYFGLIRIDMYSDGNDFYIGEITNCDNGGNYIYKPDGAELKLSKMIFGD